MTSLMMNQIVFHLFNYKDHKCELLKVIDSLIALPHGGSADDLAGMYGSASQPTTRNAETVQGCHIPLQLPPIENHLKNQVRLNSSQSMIIYIMSETIALTWIIEHNQKIKEIWNEIDGCSEISQAIKQVHCLISGSYIQNHNRK